MRRDALPWLLLLALLALQTALTMTNPTRSIGGDEPYYVGKALYLTEHSRLERAQPHVLAVESGEWGSSDWRPPGYALVVFAIAAGDFDPVTLRRRVTIVQLVAILIAELLAFSMLRQLSFRARIVAALVLGIAPWPFAFVTTIGPDSLNASVAFFGLYALGRRRLFLGSLFLSSTFLLRPDMIAVVPIPCAIAALWCAERRVALRRCLTAAAAFLLVFIAQYSYRTYFVGRPTLSLFGGLHIYNAGAFAWANSWIGTEHEAYDFVYGLSARDTTGALPARAFADAQERRRVDELRAAVREHGYGQEIDRRFSKLARERIRKHPLAAAALPRLWHAVHLWINLATCDQLLHAMTFVQRPVRRAIWGTLLALKVGLVVAFIVRTAAAIRFRSATPELAIMASFVLTRTVLIGLVLNWMVSRYMVTAWLPLIVVALMPVRSARAARA